MLPSHPPSFASSVNSSSVPDALRIRFLGLGEAGLKIASLVSRHGPPSLEVHGLDFDPLAFERTAVPHPRLLAFDLTRGLDSGGDLAHGRELASFIRAQVSESLEGIDAVFLAVGLGSGTGAALAEQVSAIARLREIKTVVLATLPFSKESRQRQQQAQDSLAALRASADVVLAFENERLLEGLNDQVNARNEYPVLNLILAQVASALYSLLVRRGLIPCEWTEWQSFLGVSPGMEKQPLCWAGRTEGSIEASSEDLVEALLKHPFLKGLGKRTGVERAMLCLGGGHDLALPQIQNLVKTLTARLPHGIKVIVGASRDPAWEGRIGVTLICTCATARAEESSAGGATVPASSAPIDSRALRAERARQAELPLESLDRGRFASSSQVIYRGQDLDQPTYRRRGLKLRL